MKPLHILLLLSLWLCAALPAGGTVLAELSLEELVERSALIFVGEVLETEVVEEDDLVYTWVSFSVQVTTRGSAGADILKLRFLGGAGQTLHVDVAGQFIPPAGTRGLFFVTDIEQQHVNPLTGWSQGYFPLLGEGDARWLDLREHPDYGVVLGAAKPLAGKMRTLGFSNESIDARVPPVLEFPLADFLAVVRQVMALQEQ